MKKNILRASQLARFCHILFLLLYFQLEYFPVVAQPDNYIKGKVNDGATGTPIANCSVFINSTSRGTTTNDAGEFELRDLPSGAHQLIISSIGYQTFSYDFSSNQLPLDFNVTLKEKTTNLKQIIIEPDVKDGWRTWGKTFLNNFIGTTENAEDCSIKNISALHFHFSKKTNRLGVSADEPLIIENLALGYSIKYQLEEFYLDFHEQISFYLGFPFFTELVSDRKRKRTRWEEKRNEAYLGSMLHFMRSIYKGQSVQEGFQIIRKVKVLNIAKKQVKDMYRAYQSLLNDTMEIQKNGTLKKVHHDHIMSDDSVEYYSNILSKPDYTEVFRPVQPDSLVSTIDDETKSLFFTDSIFVVYKNPKSGSIQQSMIYLTTPAPLTIYSNGIYYPPQELVTNGFWGRYAKMANDLPIDYKGK